MNYVNRSTSTSRGSDHKGVLVLCIIEPANAKRYQLRISGKLSKLTVGKLKESLRSGSSCNIPVPWMRLEYKSFVLSNDNQKLCSVLNLDKNEVVLHVYDNRVSEEYNIQHRKRSGNYNNNNHNHSFNRQEINDNMIKENYEERSRNSTAHEYKSQSHKSSLLSSPVELTNCDYTSYTSVNNRNFLENSANIINEVSTPEFNIPSVLLPQTSPVRNRLHMLSHRTANDLHNEADLLERHRFKSESEEEKKRKQTLPFCHNNYVNSSSRSNYSYGANDSTTSPLTIKTTPLRRHSNHLFNTQTGNRVNKTPITTNNNNNNRSINISSNLKNKNGVKIERSFVHDVSSSPLPVSQSSLSATCHTPIRRRQITIMDNTFYDAWENAQEHVQRVRSALGLSKDKIELTWHVASHSTEQFDNSDYSRATATQSHFVATCTLHEYYIYKWQQLQNGKESKQENTLRKVSYEEQQQQQEQQEQQQKCEEEINGQCKDNAEAEKTKKLIMTYDSQTERLYLYSTLQTFDLEEWQNYSMSAQLQLCEFLLQASLLGRNVCGGAISIERCQYTTKKKSCVKNWRHDKNEKVELICILLSTSLYMPTSQPWSLLTILPHFVNTLQYWKKEIGVFIAQLDTTKNNNRHSTKDMKITNDQYGKASPTCASSSSSHCRSAHVEPKGTTPRKSFLLFNYNRNKQHKEKEYEEQQSSYKRMENEELKLAKRYE